MSNSKYFCYQFIRSPKSNIASNAYYKKVDDLKRVVNLRYCKYDIEINYNICCYKCSLSEVKPIFLST